MEVLTGKLVELTVRTLYSHEPLQLFTLLSITRLQWGNAWAREHGNVELIILKIADISIVDFSIMCF